MDDLVKLVSKEANIPEEKAQKATETVIAFLKEKLPEPMASQIEGALDNPEVLKGAESLLKQGLGFLKNK